MGVAHRQPVYRCIFCTVQKGSKQVQSTLIFFKFFHTNALLITLKGCDFFNEFFSAYQRITIIFVVGKHLCQILKQFFGNLRPFTQQSDAGRNFVLKHNGSRVSDLKYQTKNK